MAVDAKLDYSNLKLGESSDLLSLSTSEEHRLGCLELIKQARRSITIFAYDLEPKIYNNRELVSALRSFIAAERHSQVRILIRDSKNMVLHGHQLLELSRALSSYITIKKLSPEDHRLIDAYLIADETGIAYRSEALRFEGTLNFNDRGNCREILGVFDAAWHRATPDPELRRLYL